MKALAKRAVAPVAAPLRRRLAALSIGLGNVEERLARLEPRVDGLEPRVDELEHGRRALAASAEDLALRLPAAEQLTALMANISHQNATFRQMRRDSDSAIHGIWDTQSRFQSELTRLEQRLETIRSEVMYEIRYGRRDAGDVGVVEPKVLTPGSLDGDAVRLNLGSGHLPVEGYVNVDGREIPGVDVVAEVANLPVEQGSVAEIFSSHLL